MHTAVGRKVVLAEDVMRHRPVAIKFASSAEKLEMEASILGVVGPEVAPEVYDAFHDEAGAGGRQHLLVMQVGPPSCNHPRVTTLLLPPSCNRPPVTTLV